MDERFSRTALLYGDEAMKRLADARVAVFGVGGVGGYVVEALARSGIGALDLIDNDKVCLSNINRQIIATTATLGQYKVDAAEARVKDIAPECTVRTYKTFFLPDTQDRFDFTEYDYVVDAIDTVTGKLAIIAKAKAAGVPVISAMGAGNKTDPTAFEVADIYDTTICPLAKIMRKECRKRGIESLKVVYSKEEPRVPLNEGDCAAGTTGEASADSCAGNDDPGNEIGEIITNRKRVTPGSTAFVPSVVGLIIAGEIVNELTGMA
ncbi:MAG: tRNA threonylcarbamoyladenosine dehydratase [Lachnospiraceae bacterium]|nr:tRNA threonylcarbamoyladenosine dehydratase [Lachnospiraceae bacterium]